MTAVDNQLSQSWEADVVAGHTPDEDQPVGFEEFTTTVTQHYREKRLTTDYRRLREQTNIGSAPDCLQFPQVFQF